ncbi:3-hydroxyisobutyrate dehydrogenase [Sinorhizobium meliloti]|uniref:NADPH-dependent F420 reductase n=1 Tax=Rhizobium meliloti TaxID=382 RepID=UPI001295D957|nr:NAD(P)-binding domain-containing protein [Sinorhizobium meliloti]MDW9486226.1 3-hydroxyisobutyrate dehydrogenase [Sinorhizobium meliloti]MDW9605117.1 3-hydroxyisobutyrate dehydrogenase [Sinorhizobium meliloti]MDW9629142.1 3-hydroxyisobutyrate dehydrogenase [Sinorhizobium meliloti]MDW9675216.1 3-hydroxyisobutyrate dehydrogenase [Sinorhizobium meliloti]MDW9919389.1 3-hydroxyisobutyrate dehydrogenase [Sinorhizobium meliloti]
MKIGIIGAGNIGGTIARKLAAAGHSVKLAGAEGPDSISDKAAEIGATPVTAQDAVKEVDVIILSIPFAEIPNVAGVFADVPANVVVIDTSNYYPFRDGSIADVDDGKPESVWSSEQLGRPVVKAFNAALAETLANGGTAEGTANRIAIPVAGDDAQAKAVARGLVNETGFDALDAGDLAGSWRQQPGTPAYCTELALSELRDALSKAEKARAPKNRDALIKSFTEDKHPLTHGQIVARNREVTAPK